MSRIKKLIISNYDARQQKRSVRQGAMIAAGVLAALAVVSLGYAAASGALDFYGIAARGEVINVQFANARFLGSMRAGEAISIPAAADYQSLQIEAQLMMPGDSRVVQFQIQNTGNQAVRLLGVRTEMPDTAETGLKISWPDEIPESPTLTNHVLVPGAVSDIFLIYIEWDLAAVNVPSGQYRNFSLTLDYQNALIPLDEGPE